jgi:hypothetical protein
MGGGVGKVTLGITLRLINTLQPGIPKTPRSMDARKEISIPLHSAGDQTRGLPYDRQVLYQ